jgi:hypothetical protein
MQVLLAASYVLNPPNPGGVMHQLPELARYLGPQLPQLLVYLVGVVLSLVFWGRHPKVSGLTLVAMILLILTSVVSAGVYIWLPRYFFEHHYSRSNEGSVYAMVNMVIGVVRAVGLGICLAAVFSMRSGESDYGAHVPPPMPPKYR